MEKSEAYNPLDKANLGRSVVEALLRSTEFPLSEVRDPEVSSSGAGIYAIYYRGSFEAYAPLATINKLEARIPIYVGKAIPKGGRKGSRLTQTDNTQALTKRLSEHGVSIASTSSLDLEDFSFRRLVVDDIWISLGESIVIDRFRPLWNLVVEGFGNHNPGAGRFKGRRPLWDELHPGRDWAEKCAPPKKNRDEILTEVRLHLRGLSDIPGA